MEDNNKKCKYCGKMWEFSYKVVCDPNGNIICYHDNKAFEVSTTDDESYNQRLLRRVDLLKEHQAKKLPKSYYKKDKETGEMSLLPSHIKKLGY